MKPLPRLADDQLRASNPDDHAALSASAGTGKTHVLTARVLRLLLSGADPASILCLTFTKAGAAEMAGRIHERLAHWVRLKDAELARELAALGEDVGPATRASARTLFARVLDAVGGGLRIQTIHAFAQSLLGAFPAEAGLVPGFRLLDARDEQALIRQTLAELFVRSQASGDSGLLRDVQALSRRLGEGGAEDFLVRCARAPAAMAALGARESIEPQLRRAFDLPLSDIEGAIASACGDDRFDLMALYAITDANRAWGTATGMVRCDTIAAWLAGDGQQRAAMLDGLAKTVLTNKGELRKVEPGLIKTAPDYAGHAARLAACCQPLLALRAQAALVAIFAAGLRSGQSFAHAYTEAKRALGVADFDDLIQRAEHLLLEPGIGEWVRYKLDQATDHILVDEAQDTNERQWNIVRALSLEFFAGEGASTHHRTMFTVGDYKQAIFGFQGTDPASFDAARAWFSREAQAVNRAFFDLSMDRSFRSSPPVLAVVDRVIANLGHDALGLPRRPGRHSSHHIGRPGSVVLWQPVTAEISDDEENGGREEEKINSELGEEGWLSDSTRLYAKRLAQQVRYWLDHPFAIHKDGKQRPVRPEDILILVRKRGALASLIVARLYAEAVPVAGVDRLLLSAPLAVRDLLAAARFAAQPLDDLNLASLLVSPLFGWSQEELFAIAHARKGSLWTALRQAAARQNETVNMGDAFANADLLHESVANLLSILAMADYATPHQFFETILSGKIQGRRKLVMRLGAEARDPIEELINQALAFEARANLSLQHFLDWFARGEVEITRDPSISAGAVRVMTAHGAKGLQSPIVILADACLDPARMRGASAHIQLFEDGPAVPIFRPRKDELPESLAAQLAAQEKLELEEHWRLLYVALTRAEERLYIGGSLGPADRQGPPQASWHRAVETALSGLGASWREDPLWGNVLRYGDAEASVQAIPKDISESTDLPLWLFRAAPVEMRTAPTLTPSALGEEGFADPPPSPAMREAALRGKLLHQLFERLPATDPLQRREYADRWLDQSAGINDAGLRHALIEDVLRILADPQYTELFGPSALAEAPITALLPGGQVVAGVADRLLVTAKRILVADFKTGRHVPASVNEVPAAHIRQMAAYTAALRVIFPDRSVEAALLYTSGPVLHALPSALLNAPEMAG